MNQIDFLITYTPVLLQATLVTLQVACGASIIGFVLGTLLGVLHTRPSLLAKLISGYVALLRGTPMLIQIVFLHYFLPDLGINLPEVWTATIAIGINSSAYISQVVRAGIQGVSHGQVEAATVLGLSKAQTMRLIVLPQAIASTAPSLLNEAVTLIKDSSLAYVIGVVELFKQGTLIISRTYQVIPVYCIMALIYLVLTGTLSICVHLLSKRLGSHAQSY